MADVSTTAPTMNRQVVRGGILVTILCASAAGTRGLAGSDYRHILILVHLLSFASWFGCSVWVSFVAGIVTFKSLPRHVFGRLMSRLFPAYFKFSVVTVTAAIFSASALEWPTAGLVAVLGTVLANLFFLEPETTRVMFLRHAVEKRLGTGHEVGQLKPSDPAKANDPELRALSKKFGMLHGISTLLNMAALGIGCVWLNFCAREMAR
mmetsp:Transcript_14957/g.29893  ORF Transcript_14957/g.29893 Transcript_14957/m.29893 type:complete len:208 (+) Transcript_14957:150-773(+)